METTADELIEFARVWSRYGGGSPGDILVQFGLTEHQYFRRLSAAVSREKRNDCISREDLMRIQTVCNARLIGLKQV